MPKIDIAQRYVSAFGLFGFDQSSAGRVKQENGSLKFEQYAEGDRTFEDVTFRYEDKELKFAAFPFVASASGASSLNVIAPPPMISFSREKTLVITPLNDESVEVVERWNNNAWEIKIQGLLIDMDNHNYPTDLVEKVRRMFEYNNVIEVSGTQFYEKNIDFVYFKGIEVSGVSGYPDTVQFSISARSIRDIGFKIGE